MDASNASSTDHGTACLVAYLIIAVLVFARMLQKGFQARRNYERRIDEDVATTFNSSSFMEYLGALFHVKPLKGVTTCVVYGVLWPLFGAVQAVKVFFIWFLSH